MKIRPVAELLTLGTELLTGSVLNTNAAYLGRELTQLGFEVHHQAACRDEPPAIQEALRSALGRSHVILMSGGLGPTPDDVTREA
jgi:nicotinamide-nucleotide amidase